MSLLLRVPSAVKYEFVWGNVYKGVPLLTVNATTGEVAPFQRINWWKGMREFNMTLRIFNNNTDGIKGPQNAETFVNVTFVVIPVYNPPIVRWRIFRELRRVVVQRCNVLVFCLLLLQLVSEPYFYFEEQTWWNNSRIGTPYYTAVRGCSSHVDLPVPLWLVLH